MRFETTARLELVADAKCAFTITNQEYAAVARRVAPTESFFEYRLGDAFQRTILVSFHNRLK
jgi:hypothetical protein